MVYFDNKIITLNSAYGTKQNGTLSSLLLFNFQGLLKEEHNIIRSYISVVNAQFPASFYTINATNNSFVFVFPDLLITIPEVGDPVPAYDSQYTIAISNGNYNATSLMNALINAFDELPIAGFTMAITINKLTGRLTFKSLYGPEFGFQSSSTDMTTILGVVGWENQISVDGSYTAAYPLNLLGIKVISIKSSILAISAYTSETLGFSNTLATIPVDVPSFNMVSYVSNNDLDKHILRTKFIDAIDISIMDEDENLIDFNNINWTLTLSLSIEREDILINNLDLHRVVRDNAEKISNPTLIHLIKEKELTQDEKDLNLLSK